MAEGEAKKQLIPLIPGNPAVATEESIDELDKAIADLMVTNRLDMIRLEELDKKYSRRQ